MRTVTGLVVLMLSAAPAVAAPAPFAKPMAEPDPAVVVEQLKQFMLREHNTYADNVVAGSKPNEWIITGNTPMAPYGQLEYAQRRYRVTANAGDRHTLRFTVSILPIYGIYGRVATR